MALTKCEECGKEFSDTLNSCPHCGFVIKNINEYHNEQQKDNGIDAFCLAGGIVAICSWVLDFLGLVAITGIVLSVLGLDRVKVTGAKGKAWAIVGIVLGTIEAAWKAIQLLSLL